MSDPPPSLPDPSPTPLPSDPSVADLVNSFARGPLTFDEAALRLEAIMSHPDSDPRLKSLINTRLIIGAGPGGRRKANRWSSEEDERLVNAVRANGTEDWTLIAASVGGGRTRAQCAQRWNRGLDPKISKANWSREEELKLIGAVEFHGARAWTKVAGDLGNRSDVQCRFRYSFLMAKAKEAGGPIQPISPSREAIVGAHGGDGLVIP
jgi:hypothetical protein